MAAAWGLRLVAESGPALSLSPVELDFGRVAIGSAAEGALVATNDGTRRILVESVRSDAPFAPVSPAFALEPGESRALAVAFRPDGRGPAAGALVLVSQGREIPVPLRGTGYAPAEIRVDPLSLSFGDVTVGETSQGLVTIRNDGDEELDLVAVRADRPFAVGGADGVVAPGASLELPISFAPQHPGRFEGKLWIENSDPNRTRVGLHLRGSGTAIAPRPEIEASVGALDFGSVRACESSERTVEIANRGTDALTVASVTALPPFSAPARGFRLEPGRSVRLSVTFLPKEAGPAFAPLLVHSNDPGSRVLALGLVGEGRSAAKCDDRATARATRPVTRRREEAVRARAGGDGWWTASAPPGGPASAPRADAPPPSDAEPPPPTPDATAAAQGPPPVREGSFVDLASYRSEVTAEHVATVRLDAASGHLALDGVQLPVVQLPFDQFFDFEPTAARGQMNELGDVDLVLPVEMRDEAGNPTHVEVALTTGTASTFRPDGTLVTLAGEPFGGQGDATLVGLATLPSGGLRGATMEIVLNVRVAR